MDGKSDTSAAVADSSAQPSVMRTLCHLCDGRPIYNRALGPPLTVVARPTTNRVEAYSGQDLVTGIYVTSMSVSGSRVMFEGVDEQGGRQAIVMDKPRLTGLPPAPDERREDPATEDKVVTELMYRAFLKGLSDDWGHGVQHTVVWKKVGEREAHTGWLYEHFSCVDPGGSRDSLQYLMVVADSYPNGATEVVDFGDLLWVASGNFRVPQQEGPSNV